MRKSITKLALLLSFVLVFQLLVPFGAVQAALASPTNLTHKFNSPSDIQLSWTAVSGATNYRIYELNGVEKKLLFTLSGTTRVLSGVTEGTHTYAVSAATSSTESALSAPVNVSVDYPDMQPPAWVKSSVSNGNDLTISWGTALYGQSYSLYEIINGTKKLITSTSGGAKILSAVSEGTHTYVVTASNTLYGESAPTEPLVVDIVYPTILPPTGITTTVFNGNDLSLRWQAAANATSYKIYELINGQRTLLASASGTSRTLTSLSEGVHTYEITTYSDRFGESKTAATVSYDMIWPTLPPPTELKADILNGNDIRLTWPEVQYATGYIVYRVIDGQRDAGTTVTGATKTFANLPEGHYRFEVTTLSERFGQSKAATSIELDLHYPVIVPPATGRYSVDNGNDLLLNWSAANFADKYNVYEVINGERTLVASSSGFGVKLTNVTQGLHNYEVTTVSSRFGESDTALPIKVDLVYPIMQPPLTVKATVLNGNDLTLSWDFAQYANSYKVYLVNEAGEIVYKTTTGSNKLSLPRQMKGVYTYEIRSYSDRFGDSPTGTRVEAVIDIPDLKAPELSLSMSAPTTAHLTWMGMLYGDSYNIYRVVDGKKQLIGNTASTKFDVAGLNPQEAYDFVVTTVSNNFGESDPSNVVSAKFDVTPPTTAATFPDRWVKNDLRVSLGAVDYESGVDKTYYSLDGLAFVEGREVIVAEVGLHSLTFYSVDKAGNVEEKKTVELKIDKVAPVTVSDYKESNTLPAAINFTATDDLSGVRDTYYSINDGLFVKGTAVEITPDVRKVTFYSVDNAGNEEERQTINLASDVNAPVTTSNITDEWLTEDFTVQLTATDDLSGVAKTYYAIGKSTDYLEGSSVTISKEGETLVKFYSVDNQGNVETVQSATVKIDKTAPVTETAQPKEWENGDYVLRLNASDDHSGVAKTLYSLNGGELTEGTSLSIVEEGIHEITYYSVDNVGHQEEPKTVKIRLDKTAPVTTYTQTKDIVSNDVTLQLTANDALSGVASTAYSINGGEMVEGNVITLAGPGRYSVSFRSVDIAGNVEQSTVLDILIDTQAPVTKSSVTDEWNNKSVPVSLSAEDDLSGVDKTFYSVNGAAYVEGTNFLIEDEGEHKVTFYSIDKAGNVEVPNTVTVMIDKTKPVTESNLTGSYAQPGFEVLLNATDDRSGVAKTWYSINGNTAQEGTSFKLEESGSYRIVYYSVDNAKNVEQEHVYEILIDNEPPVTVSNLENGIWYNKDIAGQLIAKDAGIGVDKTYYALNGTVFAEGTQFALTEEGEHNVSFYSTDKAGNVEEVKTVTVLLDKTAPVTASNLTGTVVVPGQEVVLSPTDNLSGVAATYYSLNGEPAVEGTSFQIGTAGVYQVIYYSVDKAGNKEKAVIIELTVDETAPVTKSDATGVWTNQDVTVTLTATDDISGVDKTYYSVDGGAFVEGTVLTITEPGIHTVTFYSVDKAGNVEAKKSSAVKIDEQAPVTAADAPQGWVNAASDVKLNATDDLSGVAATYYAVDGGEFKQGTNVQFEAPGIHKVTFYSVDIAGNVEAEQTIEVMIDQVAPVTVSDAPQGWQTQDVEITLTATDDLSGVDKTYYSVDGGEFQEGTFFAITEPGVHEVLFYSVDKAGNIEGVNKVQVKLDEQAPVTAAEAPQGWVNQDAGITLIATDDLSGVDKTYYSVDGGEFIEGSSIKISESGKHTVTFYSVDVAGNVEAVQTIEVLIDEQPPVTTADAPQGWQVGDVSITLTATDDLSGVDKTYYSVDGGEFVEGTSVLITEPGKHTVTFYSVDKAGNVEAQQTIEVLIDELPPVTTSDIQDIWTNQDVPVALTATDDLSGVKTTYYTVDDASQQEGTSFTVTGEGIHKVTFYSVDNAGNIEQANTAEVKIDKTAPTVILAPLKSEYVMGDKPTLSYTATDNLSGIASSVMTINGKEVANGTTLTLQPGEYTVQVTATDNAGNKTTTTVQQKFVVAILAEMEVTPMVINPNPGIFTVRLTMPKGYKYNFDIPTVSVNGAKVRGNGNPEGQAASGMFKFERMDVEKWIMPETTLVFRGYTKDGYLVIAKKTVKVNDADGGKGNTKGNGKGK